MAAIYPRAGHVTYCATKTFASYMANGLSYEFNGKVDVLSYEPSQVATNILPGSGPKVDFTPIKLGLGSKMLCWVFGKMVLTPDRAATVCFRDLGYQQSTHGGFRHELMVFIINMFPRTWMNHMMFPVMQNGLLEGRAKEQLK